VRAEADELEVRFVRLAVDQDEVGPYVTIAVIAPLAAERVVEIPPGQRLVLGQYGDCFEELGIEALAVAS
jgi:allophanate hydrolase subunit 2